MSLKWNLKWNNSHDIASRQKINQDREAHLLMIKVQPTKRRKGKDRRNNHLFKKLRVFISQFVIYIWVLFSYPNFLVSFSCTKRKSYIDFPLLLCSFPKKFTQPKCLLFLEASPDVTNPTPVWTRLGAPPSNVLSQLLRAKKQGT